MQKYQRYITICNIIYQFDVARRSCIDTHTHTRANALRLCALCSQSDFSKNTKEMQQRPILYGYQTWWIHGLSFHRLFTHKFMFCEKNLLYAFVNGQLTEFRKSVESILHAPVQDPIRKMQHTVAPCTYLRFESFGWQFQLDVCVCVCSCDQIQIALKSVQ